MGWRREVERALEKRDMRIRRDRKRGLTLMEVARRHDVSHETVRQVCKEEKR